MRSVLRRLRADTLLRRHRLSLQGPVLSDLHFSKNNLISLVTRLGKNGSFVSCRLHPETVCQITRCKKHSIACVLWKHQFYIKCIREEIVILIF